MIARKDLISPFLFIIVHRHKLFDAVKLDVRQKYVGSLFGSFWAVIFPLIQLSIYAGLYTVIFKVRPSGLTEWGYVLLVFSGLIPLLTFSEILSTTSNSFSANKNILMNTVYPAELIPLRVALSAQVPGICGLLITLSLGFFQGRTSYQALILVPVFWLLLLMFSLGIGWLLSLASLVAKDIQHALSLIIMLMIVLSPFAFTPEMVPTALKPIIYINPLSYFVLTFQQLICYGVWPNLITSMVAVGLGLSSFLFGFRTFNKAKAVFFDYA